jgi:hypothetical protein
VQIVAIIVMIIVTIYTAGAASGATGSFANVMAAGANAGWGAAVAYLFPIILFPELFIIRWVKK